MLGRTLTIALGLVGFALQVQAHCIITPALGVAGKATRNDVTRTSNNNPCGNQQAIAAAGSSTAVNADANGWSFGLANTLLDANVACITGSFKVTAEGFNG